jgi:hypothetical protein
LTSFSNFQPRVLFLVCVCAGFVCSLNHKKFGSWLLFVCFVVGFLCCICPLASVSAEISRATARSSKKGRRERRDIESRARRGAGEEEREIWSKREGERMHIANNEYVDPDKEQGKKGRRRRRRRRIS